MNFSIINLSANNFFWGGLLLICSQRQSLQLPGDFAPVQQSSSPIWKPQRWHKGLTEITVRHCIKRHLPRGRFDWLKHGSAASVAIFHAEEAHSGAPTGQVHNTYLYLQCVEHLYLYAFHLRATSYLLTSGGVSRFCGRICLLCIF